MRCNGYARNQRGSDTQRPWECDLLPVSLSCPPAVPSVGANGQSTGPGDRSGAGSIDSRGAGRERDRGARLAQRAYLALSAVWQLLAALAVLRNRRFQEAVEPALDPPI
jgi:hypothetical protein